MKFIWCVKQFLSPSPSPAPFPSPLPMLFLFSLFLFCLLPNPCECFLPTPKAALVSSSDVLECDEQLSADLIPSFSCATENTQTEQTVEPTLGSGLKVGLAWLCGVSAEEKWVDWRESVLVRKILRNCLQREVVREFFPLYQTYITCKTTGCHFRIVGVGVLLSWKLHETILFRKYSFKFWVKTWCQTLMTGWFAQLLPFFFLRSKGKNLKTCHSKMAISVTG